jgi:peptidyl-prolyl cis-trans isomerase B (cyclophilin B)
MTDPQPPVPPVPSPDGATPPPPAAPVAPTEQPAYPAYGQPAAPGYYAPPTNTLAILALVLGFVVPLGGIICGHLALGQIKRTGEGGHGLAMAGLIIGYALTGLTILVVIGYIVAIALTFGAVATYGSTY